MAGAVTSRSTLPKATLAVVGAAEQLRFRYNPTEYTVAKTATWRRTPTRGAESSSTPDYTGTNPTAINMEVFFDAFEEPGGDVSQDVDTLLRWTRPTPESHARGEGQPPLLRFIWGANPVIQGFQGYLKSVSARYTMFRLDGTPIRATASIALEEVTEPVARQNPTSGAREGRRGHILAEGETLHSLAHSEYGDAAFWRGLAVFNGVDDPMRLAPGTELLIPTRSEAQRLSEVGT